MVEEADSIRCMQMPLMGMQMLLPNSAVAEIIGYDRALMQAGDSGPLLGHMSWRGVTVPVVSLEVLCGNPMEDPGGRSRVAIVYHPDGDHDLPYIGILLQDIPRAYLAESQRLLGKGEATDCPYLTFRIEAMIDDYVLPDVDAIFAAIRGMG